MQRRKMLAGTLLSFPVLGMKRSRLAMGEPAAPKSPATAKPAAAKATAPTDKGNLEARFRALDATIKTWWDKDQGRADESEILNDKARTLLFLPLPFSTAAGTGSAYPDLYAWDTQFLNQALLAHGRVDLALHNVRNHLFLIDRFGFILNGNRSFYETRSQTPLLWWSVEECAARETNKDARRAFLMEAYPRLEREYLTYWNADHHKTPTGLCRAFDLGDKSLRPELAAEAETGLDFTPIFGGDVRHCVPLMINAALIRYAQTLSTIAKTLGLLDRAAAFAKDVRDRTLKLNQLCWNDKEGFYFEYDYEKKKQLPFKSLLAYWLMWAGVPSKAQAKRMVDNLKAFDCEHGLPVTPEEYPSPHKEFKRLQWNHPSAWPPLQVTTVLALQRYGFKAEAKRVAERFLRNQLDTWDATGKLWERYDAVKGGQDLKMERAEAFPFHGWSAASVVLLGRQLFPDKA